MKRIFGTILILIAVPLGVLAMAGFIPLDASNRQVQPFLVYGTAMFMSGAASLAIILIGITFLHEADLDGIIEGNTKKSIDPPPEIPRIVPESQG